MTLLGHTKSVSKPAFSANCGIESGVQCHVSEKKSLYEEKFRKENMEHEFGIREELYGQAKARNIPPEIQTEMQMARR